MPGDAGATRRTADRPRRRATICLALTPALAFREVRAAATGAAAASRDAGVAAAFGTAVHGGQILHRVAPGESLALIGARLGIEPRIIARENGLAPTAALRPGQSLSIDHRRVVPALLEDGILVNVAQRMLYLFERASLSGAWPVAVGKPSWPTPLGGFHVTNRQTDKPWIVPRSIQEEMRREGRPVLTRVEPGPDNPLGRHWIGLSIPALGIHGTTAPSSIHDFRSHGCIRMHPDDVAQVYARVATGTPGAIVYRSALLAELPDGRIFAEADRDAYRRGPPPFDALRALADERNLSARIDWGKVRLVARDLDGVARDVTLAATPGAVQPDRAPDEHRNLSQRSDDPR